MIYLQDPDVTLHHGDVLDTLRGMPNGSVDCVVTSPPYWGLRDYGTGLWTGGDPDCDHTRPRSRRDGAGRPRPDLPNPPASWAERDSRVTTSHTECECGATRQDQQLGLEATPDLFVARMVDVFREVRRVLAAHGTCWVNLGDSYAQGIGMARGQPYQRHAPIKSGLWKGTRSEKRDLGNSGAIKESPGLKSKDLVGIPWRVAFALQADGWYLRSDIVWSKPNPMRESVTDRPTKAHEMIFLLTKAPWHGPEKPLPHVSDEDARWLALLIDTEGNIVLKPEVFAAQIAVGNTHRPLLERAREIVGMGTVLERPGKNAPLYYWQLSDRQATEFLRRIYPHLIVKQRQARVAIHAGELRASRGRKRPGRERDPAETTVLTRCWETIKSLNHFGDPDISWVPLPKYGRWGASRYWFDQEAVREPALRAGDLPGGDNGRADGAFGVKPHGPFNGTVPAGRNIRSVWEIATQPYPEAHFATYPEELVRRCLLAGCPEWVCRVCGVPRTRIVELTPEYAALLKSDKAWRTNEGKPDAYTNRQQKGHVAQVPPKNVTKGWSDCGHNDYRPGRVLDPFVGSGTTAHVARKHGRHAVGIDLNADYLALAAKRLQQLSLFAEGVA